MTSDGGLENCSRTAHGPVGVEGPTTNAAVMFVVTEHEVAFTPHTQTEQFCELGKKMPPVITAVAFGYKATGLT